MEVRESFIFHAEYIADIPDELQPQYAMYAINYALKGIEPELTDWRDIKMWNNIKNRIDGEAEQYEATIKARAAAGRSHKGNQYTRKNQEEPNNNNLEQSGTKWNKTEQSGTNGTVSVFVSEFVNESDSETESVPEAPAPSRESPSATDYSNKIFKIFQEAGLPCARDNPISFLQRDFKNAMAYLHKTPGLNNLHSDDVIAAARNYAKTVTDPESYITGKYSFDRFVTFKNFVDFLPENYTPDNFKATRSGKSPEAKPRREWMDTCPACKKKSLAYDNAKQKYVCTDCGREFEYEEVNK
jgi:ribosomal protein S27E